MKNSFPQGGLNFSFFFVCFESPLITFVIIHPTSTFLNYEIFDGRGHCGLLDHLSGTQPSFHAKQVLRTCLIHTQLHHNSLELYTFLPRESFHLNYSSVLYSYFRGRKFFIFFIIREILFLGRMPLL